MLEGDIFYVENKSVNNKNQEFWGLLGGVQFQME
jgi:hypothetical protein